MTEHGVNKWVALSVLCLGTLMIVLDTTIVNVALPSIRTRLGFSEVSLAWVINAYILTFGGFLMLGGRLGDLFGQRKLFLIGLTAFTLASLACGLATTQWFLLLGRGIQGIGGAVVEAVSLSLLMGLFTEEKERARAMGYFGFVAAGGGSVGVLLGGILTGSVNWHAIFLVNIPIGILVFLLSLKYLPKSHTQNGTPHLDAWGAVTITASLVLAVYAIVNGNDVGWLSMQTISLLCISILLLATFIKIEYGAKSPLIPLNLFKLRNFTVANIVGVLWSAGMFAWFFISALYLQLVLGYDPLHVGFAFLPANLVMAVLSFSISAKLVNRYGIKRPLAYGLGLAALGLLWFARVPVNGNFWIDILPSMLLLGIGAGIAFNPVLLAAMNDVSQDESGIASGATAAAKLAGADHPASLTAGYHAAFFVGALCAGLGAVLAATLLTTKH
jgi:EmrB/QacA subfamily drug resistance transporter